MSNKSTVPPYTKTDGTKVRGHVKRKPKSGPRRGADPAAAIAAAAAAETTAHTDPTPDLNVDPVDGGLYDIVGSLARRGKPETDAQQRLSGALKQFFVSLESWKGTLLNHADLMAGCKLTGRNLTWATVHYQNLLADGKNPSGIMLPRSEWEQKHDRQVVGEGFGITVPQNFAIKETETDPDTGEETEVTVYQGKTFRHGGKNRRYYDGCETVDENGSTFVATEQSLLVEAHNKAVNRVKRGDLTSQQVAEIKDTYMDKAASMGITVNYKPRSELGKAHGYYDLHTKQIVLADDTDDATQTATLVHELAHASDPALQGDPHAAASRYHKDRAACEYVAESVSYAILDRHGLDSSDSAALYLQSWKPERIKQAKNIYERCVKAMDNLMERPKTGDSSRSSENSSRVQPASSSQPQAV